MNDRVRWLHWRTIVDEMIAGRRPSAIPRTELAARAMALRSSPAYQAALREAEAEAGLGFWWIPITAAGVAAYGAFSWMEEREERLAVEAGGGGIKLKTIALIGLALGALYYYKTGKIPLLGMLLPP